MTLVNNASNYKQSLCFLRDDRTRKNSTDGSFLHFTASRVFVGEQIPALTGILGGGGGGGWVVTCVLGGEWVGGWMEVLRYMSYVPMYVLPEDILYDV